MMIAILEVCWKFVSFRKISFRYLGTNSERCDRVCHICMVAVKAPTI